jgi:hypothetical protein
MKSTEDYDSPYPRVGDPPTVQAIVNTHQNLQTLHRLCAELGVSPHKTYQEAVEAALRRIQSDAAMLAFLREEIRDLRDNLRAILPTRRTES